MRTTFAKLQCLLALVVLVPGVACAAPPAGLTIFAAASLTDALRDIGTLWQAAGHPKPVFAFAASSTLAKQIEQGAPADIFASADETWMDDAAQHGAISPRTRFDLAGNTLVLAERRATMKPIALLPGANIIGLLGDTGRLAVADPSHVPAGIYARQSLEKLGLWAALSNRLAPAADVRAALLLLQHGEAPAAIVYGSDVHTAHDLAVAGTFPADSHDPIRYPVAATRDGASAEALAFLTFLKSDDSRVVLRHYGFTPP